MDRFTHNEVKDLAYGMDFRRPEYRREVFLRFYEFHLKYKSHPGAVYYAFPWIFKHLKMSMEQRLWFCFLNGVCQNVLTTFEIYNAFPDLEKIDMAVFSAYFRSNYKKFGWDTDRKWVKNKLEACVRAYTSLLEGRTQVEFFGAICDDKDLEINFQRLWDYVLNKFFLFGRLASFSYLEYLKIAGLPIECDSLFLDDINGSKSHRNGLCKVLGRDDLDWHDVLNPSFKEYTPAQIAWLTDEGALLLEEAKARIDDPDVGYFTLESTLCCYKSWHRMNRRYPNVYNDMFHERIKKHEAMWDKNMDFFWEMRYESLPKELLLEDNPKDFGLCPQKQNHYIQTGQVVMMDEEYPCFKNNLNDYFKS